jgi:hypothetical protein
MDLYIAYWTFPTPNIMSHISLLKWQIWALYNVRLILHSYEPKYIEISWAAHFVLWDETYVQVDVDTDTDTDRASSSITSFHAHSVKKLN